VNQEISADVATVPVESSVPWPDTTIALLTKDPGERELETLERLRRQRYAGRRSLLVIDSSEDPNGSVNSALKRAATRWEAIPPREFRHAGTRNRALEACRTPLIVYLSGDAHPIDDLWLQRLVEPLVDGRAHASYGRQRTPEPDPEREATYRYLYPEALEIKTKASIRQLGLRAFHFSDVTSAFVTDVLRSLRFPDDLPIFEDVGIAKRLLDANYRIAYVPQATVLHSHPLRARDIAQRYRRIGFVYEKLGIFEELQRVGRRSLVTEGFNVARHVSRTGRPGLRPRLSGASVGALKVAAVTVGRVQCRMVSHRQARSRENGAKSRNERTG
jgi:rhamnosyltransferase